MRAQLSVEERALLVLLHAAQLDPQRL